MGKILTDAEMARRFAIPKDGKFRFRCTGCGACCYGHDHIKLSPFDVVRAAAKLGISAEEFLAKHAVIVEGSQSHFPVVCLRMRETDGGCTLLDGTRCSVHAAKPAACVLFPLGRMMAIQNGEMELSYFLQPVRCGDSGEIHTPEEWMASHGQASGEREFRAWSGVISDLTPLSREVIPKLPSEAASQVLATLCGLIFCRYAPGEDIGAKLMENAETAKEILEMVRDVNVVPVETVSGDASPQDK